MEMYCCVNLVLHSIIIISLHSSDNNLLYSHKTVRKFEEIRDKLGQQDTAEFQTAW